MQPINTKPPIIPSTSAPLCCYAGSRFATPCGPPVGRDEDEQPVCETCSTVLRVATEALNVDEIGRWL